MDKVTQESFYKNVAWFNNFFNDLYEIFKSIISHVEGTFKLDKNLIYYPKSNYVPGIPDYHCLLMGGGSFALQMFINISRDLMLDHPHFKNEPSLTVVKIDDFDQYGLVGDYGLNVLKNRRIDDDERKGDVWYGKIKMQGSDKNLNFQAFQVLLGSFQSGDRLEDIVKSVVITPLQELID